MEFPQDIRFQRRKRHVYRRDKPERQRHCGKHLCRQRRQLRSGVLQRGRKRVCVEHLRRQRCKLCGGVLPQELGHDAYAARGNGEIDAGAEFRHACDDSPQSHRGIRIRKRRRLSHQQPLRGVQKLRFCRSDWRHHRERQRPPLSQFRTVVRSDKGQRRSQQLDGGRRPPRDGQCGLQRELGDRRGGGFAAAHSAML